jgi:adenosylcobinamide kinase/adenosylcobinamide-phosphate guanylyltransferase
MKTNHIDKPVEHAPEKVKHAEKLALTLSDNPVYLATARIGTMNSSNVCFGFSATGDPSGLIWRRKRLSSHSLANRVVLIVCVTLWCTNFFFDLQADGWTRLCKR